MGLREAFAAVKLMRGIFEMLLKYCVSFLICLFACVGSVSAAEPMVVSVKEVISNPESFEGKKISVEGAVSKFRYTTSRSGKPYTIFRIIDPEGNTLGIYKKGKVSLSKGKYVRVYGKFRMKKEYFVFRFKNIIKAKRIEEVQLGGLTTLN